MKRCFASEDFKAASLLSLEPSLQWCDLFTNLAKNRFRLSSEGWPSMPMVNPLRFLVQNETLHWEKSQSRSIGFRELKFPRLMILSKAEMFLPLYLES